MIDTSSGSAFEPLVIWGTILLSVKITTTSNSLHQFTAAIFTLYNITTFLGKHKANWYQKWPKMCQAVHCSMPSINLFRLLFYLQILQIQIVYLPRSLQSVSVTQPNNPIIQSCLSSFHIQHNLWWWYHRLCFALFQYNFQSYPLSVTLNSTIKTKIVFVTCLTGWFLNPQTHLVLFNVQPQATTGLLRNWTTILYDSQQLQSTGRHN